MDSGKEWRERRKLKVFAILGGKCVRCGFDDPRALQVDHINGQPTRKRLRLKGGAVYAWIVKARMPERYFQLLCANHNWIKRAENGEVRGYRQPYAPPVRVPKDLWPE